MDLFGLAQHSKGHFRIRGIKIIVERGQLAYSQVTLSKRWKWSRNKVRRYLKELKKNKDIDLKTKHQKMDSTTIITLLKYNQWQGNVVKNETPSETPEGHQKDTKRNTYNIDNKVKNVNKRTLLEKWLNYRKALKKPIDVKETFDLLVKRFNTEPIEKIEWVVNSSIENKWQGLFWGKYQTKLVSTNRGTRRQAVILSEEEKEQYR